MCDTMVALGSATSDGSTLFAKNSDREPDEVQNLLVVPRKMHGRGEMVRCTYISIPQARETCRVLLCRPFWMWGAEMGVNEHGVAIGNEAIFTKEKPEDTGLTGMDLLRLALERSESAVGARDTIIRLLEKHGQGGNCGYRMGLRYMNSFLIADPKEAYVLETVKRWWIWKKVETYWCISNTPTIEKEFDACAAGLIENAMKNRWSKGAKDFNFSRSYTNRLMTAIAAGRKRRDMAEATCAATTGNITLKSVFSTLRNHGDYGEFHPSGHKPSICMHSSDRLIHRSQTVGSLVSKLGPDRNIHFATGASNPCMSPFFPVFSEGTDLPDSYIPGEASFDPKSWWWKTEQLHRKALPSFKDAVADLAQRLDPYETEMLEAAEKAMLTQAEIDRWFTEAGKTVEQWGKNLDRLPKSRLPLLYDWYWKKYNRQNGANI